MNHDLTERAKQICKTNYHDCQCPIWTECKAPVGAGKEALNRWVEKVNRAAEGVRA